MRLWHVDLIPYLPRKQLLGQWRECCAIAKNIEVNGTPNHILVNKIMEYPEDEFNTYANAVIAEMNLRGYTVDPWKFYRYRNDKNNMLLGDIFQRWHNKIYLRQCMANLMEKHDCNGITDDEWKCLLNGYELIIGKKYEL